MGILQQRLDRTKSKLLNTSQELALVQEEASQKDQIIRRLQSDVLAMAAKTPDVAIPAAVTFGVAGGAYVAGAMQEFADRKGAGKVLALPTSAAVGIGGAIAAATMIEDPDIAVIATSAASGFIAGPAFELGKKHVADYYAAMEKVSQGEKKAA